MTVSVHHINQTLRRDGPGPDGRGGSRIPPPTTEPYTTEEAPEIWKKIPRLSLPVRVAW